MTVLRHLRLRVLLHVALAASVIIVMMLARQHRELNAEIRRVRARGAVLKPGDAVPAFRALSSGSDSVTIGEGAPGGRQLLFLLTKECPYCRATIPAWRQIADTANRASPVPLSVFALGLDSLDKLPEYLASYGLHARVVGFPDMRMHRIYRAIAVPQTLLLNDSGFVLYSRPGVITDAIVRGSVIAAVLRKPAKQPSKPSLAINAK
jgi:hypothetical protein